MEAVGTTALALVDVSACVGVDGLEAAGVGGRISRGENMGDVLKPCGLSPEVNSAGRGEGVAIDG